MSINKQIKKLEHYELNHRSNFMRAGALILTAATIFSMTELGDGHASHVAKRDVVTNLSYINAAENEMERIPIKFDNGLTATAHSGM